MNTLALVLVLISAIFHATWNFLVKRVHGSVTFIWLCDAISVLFYAPLVGVLFVVQHQSLSLTGIVLIVGSALLHLTSFFLLQSGYRIGDLSLVYPLTPAPAPCFRQLAPSYSWESDPRSLP